MYHGETGERVSRTRNDNGGEGSDSRVQFRPDRGGTYYIAAEAVGDAIGSYLVVTDAMRFADDCGDDPDNACAIGVGGGRDAWLEHDRDVDWFAVQLTAGRTYRFSIESRDRGNPLTHVRHYSFGTRTYFGGRVRGVYGPDVNSWKKAATTGRKSSLRWCPVIITSLLRAFLVSGGGGRVPVLNC